MPELAEERLNCPNCEAELTLHLSSDTGEQVREETGDVGICFECGQQMMFDGKEMVELDRHDLPVMSSLLTHWNWTKWNLKYSIRGN